MTRQLEPYINHESALREVELITMELRAYDRSQNSDSIIHRNLAEHDLRIAGQRAEDLYFHLHPDLRMIARTGTELVYGNRFRNDPYDFPHEELEPVTPGTTFDLTTYKMFRWYERGGSKIVRYVGNRAVILSLQALGKTLNTGGELSVVTAEEAMMALSSNE